MVDLLFVVLTLVFFAGNVGVVYGCYLLLGSTSR